MKTILIATNNKGKAAEFNALLKPLGYAVVTLADCGIVSEPEETGVTFAENASIKAHAAFTAAGSCMTIADDSGLEVDALCGAPGVYSARFGGRDSDRERNDFLLERLAHTPDALRGAQFVCVLCLIDENGAEHHFRGVCGGTIAFSPRGENGFGYDPVFLYQCADGETRSFAEISPQEKNTVSHRAQALEKLISFLSLAASDL
ncbi:MAG: RdgB/HAM1 family non-canonical purine NTP pyrophosphatase [Oscillospiraceae bacterium]